MHDEFPGDKGEIRGGSGASVSSRSLLPFASDTAEKLSEDQVGVTRGSEEPL